MAAEARRVRVMCAFLANLLCATFAPRASFAEPRSETANRYAERADAEPPGATERPVDPLVTVGVSLVTLSGHAFVFGGPLLAISPPRSIDASLTTRSAGAAFVGAGIGFATVGIPALAVGIRRSTHADDPAPNPYLTTGTWLAGAGLGLAGFGVGFAISEGAKEVRGTIIATSPMQRFIEARCSQPASTLWRRIADVSLGITPQRRRARNQEAVSHGLEAIGSQR